MDLQLDLQDHPGIFQNMFWTFILKIFGLGLVYPDLSWFYYLLGGRSHKPHKELSGSGSH